VPTSTRLSDTCLSFGLAFVGGYGDAASFVLAKTFTGHVTGNLVLGAIAVAAQDWRAVLGHLTAIVTFLLGVVLSIVIVRPLRVWPSWPLLPTILGIEAILMVTAALTLASGIAARAEIFVIFDSVALGLQNGAFGRVDGVSVHTTYLTGMITSLISAEAKKYTSGLPPAPEGAIGPKIGLLCGIWIAFVLGAGIGAGVVLHFKGFGILGAAVLLIALVLYTAKGSRTVLAT
jgi:uncharacterized membrane protein YoaK (UPF0700 family)